MKEYIIIANGPFLVREVIAEAVKGKVIVALDGAANRLAALEIMPDIILGDFDSLATSSHSWWGIKHAIGDSDDISPYSGNHKTTIVPADDQDYTDLEKAIHYCDQLRADDISIICATGGRLDHDEAVRRTLRTKYKSDRPIHLHTEQQTIRYAKNETVIVHGNVGDICGIIAYPKGTFTSKGLKYDCQDFKLDFGYAESISNSLSRTLAHVTIKEEALIIMPPQLAAQRQHMKLSEVERLERQLRDAMKVKTHTVAIETNP